MKMTKSEYRKYLESFLYKPYSMEIVDGVLSIWGTPMTTAEKQAIIDTHLATISEDTVFTKSH